MILSVFISCKHAHVQATGYIIPREKSLYWPGRVIIKVYEAHRNYKQCDYDHVIIMISFLRTCDMIILVLVPASGRQRPL